MHNTDPIAAKAAITHTFGSVKASINLNKTRSETSSKFSDDDETYCSRFQCLFSTPAWLILIR